MQFMPSHRVYTLYVLHWAFWATLDSNGGTLREIHSDKLN
jgi:hypothetical protein